MNGSLSAIARGARKFFGLSRMSHSVLDVPYLAIGALLGAQGFPSARVIALGLLAACAGVTAIFGLNDLLDRAVDARKMAAAAGSPHFDIDSLGLRHPLAQGKLSFGAGIAWVSIWGALAFTLAFLIQPVCALFLAAAAGFEVLYCALLRVTPVKTVFTGLNVAVGGLAAPFAVSSAPPLGGLLLYFLWAFTWEVGCRNIPNDWTDVEDDARLGIRTVPAIYGRRMGARVSFSIMLVTAASSLLFPIAAPLRAWPAYEAGALAVAAFFLVIPAAAWLRGLDRASAMKFFNRACLYPLALFAVVLAARLL